MSTERFLAVALPVPLRRLFTYKTTNPQSLLGCRVRVPFGRQHLIGVVVAEPATCDLDHHTLKSIEATIDQTPALPLGDVWTLIHKAARYYHHSLGEAFATALPNALAKGEPAQLTPEKHWHVTAEGRAQQPTLAANAVRMKRAMTLLVTAEHGLSDSELKAHDVASTTLKSLANKGWIIAQLRTPTATPVALGVAKQLNAEQQHIVDQMAQLSTEFAVGLIDGVTGSGKTEVYLHVIAQVVQQAQQVLLLVPEIGLTPQTLRRFEQRFPGQVAVMHSGMTDRQRLETWLKARDGHIRVLIGTRSSIFTPLPDLALIIIDEEHDASFKQQDGFRYHARDLAILRAQLKNIPVLLGSATPSLESLKHALSGRYHHFKLSERATGQSLPMVKLVDCKNQPLSEGFAKPLLDAMDAALKAGQQVLVFLNRRGYAPVLLCHQCGWIADCTRCDSYMTLHQSNQKRYLQCHHCGRYQNDICQCPKCNSNQLLDIGQGTERIEQFLTARYPDISLQRIDRDTTRRKQAMANYVEAAQKGETQLLIGTQMLAKGHHFPKVTLVAVLDIDGALFSSDFRAPERAAQLITQVAGRAGRAELKGQVLVQTHYPEHPLLQALTANDYPLLARQLFQERQHASLPPQTHMALFRAESLDKQAATDFLSFVRDAFRPLQQTLEIWGPVACAISRKSGRFRFQLVLNTTSRAELHNALSRTLPSIESAKVANKVRWSLDVDPQDLL